MQVVLLIELILIFNFYKKKNYLISFDAFSKWPEVYKMTKMDTNFILIEKSRWVFIWFNLKMLKYRVMVFILLT